MAAPSDVTRLLNELTVDKGEAAAKLLPLVYDELRRLADQLLRDEPRGHTLQPTALVHEVYLRLIGNNDGKMKNRAQFFGCAARAMRRLLIDHARRHRAVKRGGGRRKFSLDDVTEPSTYRHEYLIALDDALTELASLDADLSRIVELRFFGGFSVEETACVLNVSPITVKRRWKLAKGWLHREMTRGE